MKIRFNRTIPTAYGAFHFGQVIDIDKPTPDMEKWLTVPLGDGTYRAEIVRDEEPEAAVVAGSKEQAVSRRRHARGA